MSFHVGDRVRCVSKDRNAPVGIVGTVISDEPTIVMHANGPMLFAYTVKYDPGQAALMDERFPDGIPENPWDIEHVTDECMEDADGSTRPAP